MKELDGEIYLDHKTFYWQDYFFARFGDFESEFAPVMHYLIKQKDKRSHDVMEISFENPVMTKMIKPIKNLNFRSI